MSNFWTAIRTLRKQPSYAIVAVLTLAIAIAGATAIFSILDAVVLRAEASDSRGITLAVMIAKR